MLSPALTISFSTLSVSSWVSICTLVLPEMLLNNLEPAVTAVSTTAEKTAVIATTTIISTMVIMNAMAFWNDFLLPSLVLTDKKLLTLPLSTYSFYGTYSADYGTIMAGLLLCVIPILILYVVLQKQIINGVVAGAVK